MSYAGVMQDILIIFLKPNIKGSVITLISSASEKESIRSEINLDSLIVQLMSKLVLFTRNF